MFDTLIDKFQCDCLFLNDLLLKTNNQTFQIDSLLITNHLVYILEIKNYIGDFYYHSNKLLMQDQAEITNPLYQLLRTQSLFRQLLLKLNYDIPVQSSVIFINPEFMLYQAPPDIPFISPNQLNRFIKKINNNRSHLQEQHQKLAENLMTLHISDYPYKNLPYYNYQQLHKGITCVACSSFSASIIGMRCKCTLCGYEEHIDTVVVRIVKEFKLLFPEEKITTNKIYEWCKIISKKRIQRILKDNYNLVDVHRWVYYE